MNHFSSGSMSSTDKKMGRSMLPEQPAILLRPLRTDMKFDFERGTHVRVVSNTEGVIEGFVSQNPTMMKTPNFLELYEAVRITSDTDATSTEEMESIGFVRLSSRDIQSVRLIVPQHKPEMKLRTETAFHTLIISTDSAFIRLTSMLKEVKVTQVALNFYGTFVSRDGEVSWITLFIDDTLVCIDALELSDRSKDFWIVMKETLFANEKIQKVMYNARPIVDYLYHKKCILLKNVDDLQVSEFVVCLMEECSERSQKNKPEFTYKLLSDMIEVFLKDSVPAEEIKLLKKFELEDFSAQSPLMTRPLANGTYHCKGVAIEMKYLLQLSKVLREEQLKTWKLCIRAQLEELVNAGNDKMELQMRDPLHVPENVLKCCTRSPVALLMNDRSHVRTEDVKERERK